jgi:hypothetical protein
MPQYKNRMYRKEMLAERRMLSGILRAIESGEELSPGSKIPTDESGQQLTVEQIKVRIDEIDGLLDRVHKD